MTDTEFLQAQIRSLETENRALHETLRDKFAAAALQGLLAGKCVSYLGSRGWPINAEKDAWLIADAMMMARMDNAKITGRASGPG